MFSIGIDIIELNRIKNINQFEKKILSTNEINFYQQYSFQRKKEFLAGRWALKEAIFKALPQEKLLFTNIDINYNKYNQPITIIKNYQLFLSLSHNQMNAIAIAIILIN